MGRDFTWTNGLVYCRIDKVLVNDEWIIKMPQLQVREMDPMISDHSPLSIVVGKQGDNNKRLLIFYDCLAQHSDFRRKVQKIGKYKKEE